MDTVFLDPHRAATSPAVEAIARSLSGRGVLPFLGAGISCDPPSCLPLADSLSQPLRVAMLDALALHSAPVACSPDVRERVQVLLNEARLERLLALLEQTHGRQAIERYLAVLDSPDFNDNHTSIARLACAGLLPHCITLNFDALIEHAVAASGAACTVTCPLSDGRGYRLGAGTSVMTLVKPHGSLDPTAHGPSRYALLSATLREVGQYPDARNVEMFRNCLRQSPDLLVAGYSDDDWDVLPGLVRVHRSIRRVWWVQHANEDLVRRGIIPERTPVQALQRFSQSLDGRLTMLVCNTAWLLQSLCERAAPSPRWIRSGSVAITDRSPNPSEFTSPVGSPSPNLMSAVSAAILMQDHGDTTRVAVRALLESPQLQSHPRLKARLRRVLTQTEHTQRYRWRALRELNESLFLKRGADPQDLADDYVWKGYEFFSLAKRPDRDHPLRWALAPVFVVLGAYWMARGMRAASGMEARERRQLQAVAEYYRADVVHGFLESWLILGRPALWLLRPAFRLLARAYRRVHLRHPELMSHGYYWLRHLEARALAGTLGADEMGEVNARLMEIETSCTCLKNHVQIANAFLYRALVAHALGHGDEHVGAYLAKAQEHLANDSRDVVSAVDRLRLFQRLLLPRSVSRRSINNPR